MTINPVLPVSTRLYDPTNENLRNQQIEEYLRDHFTKDEMRIITALMLAWIATNFSVATYASLIDDAVSITTIGVAFLPFDNYDRQNVTAKDITVDQAAGTFAVQHEGVYQINFGANLAHDDDNAGRETTIRLFDVTEGLPSGEPSSVFIGRNQPGSNIGLSVLLEISPALVGNAFRVEIGGGSILLDVSGDASYSIFMVSEWKEPLIDPFVSSTATQGSFAIQNSFKLIRNFVPTPMGSPFVIQDTRIRENSFVHMMIVSDDQRLELGEIRNGEIDIEYIPAVMDPVEIRLLVVT